jgi:hypothetical protein
MLHDGFALCGAVTVEEAPHRGRVAEAREVPRGV